jgi:hypothetical protein
LREDATNAALVCSPASPMVLSGKSTTVTAHLFPEPDARQKLEYRWSSDAGRLSPGNGSVSWDSTGASMGPHEIKADVLWEGRLLRCTARVAVGLAGLGFDSRTTGAAFLLPDAREAKGYGLYSYLLLSRAMDAKQQARNLAVVEQYLRFPAIDDLELAFGGRAALNVTYAPVNEPPPKEVVSASTDAELRRAAEWILAHYSYARAAAILARTPGEKRGGPYFLSTLEPALQSESVPREHLWFDLYWPEPEDERFWVKEFLVQSQQEKFWDARAGRRLALNLRTLIGVVSPDLTQAASALRWYGEP